MKASKLLRRVPPRQATPDGIRLTYLHDLREMLFLVRRIVHTYVLPLIPELIADAARRRGDRLDAKDPIARLNAAVDKASRELYKHFTGPRIAAMARDAAEATSVFQREQLLKQIRSELGVDPILTEKGLAHRVEAFTSENVALIKSLPDRLFPEIEQRVIAGVRAGQQYGEIATELQDRFAVTEDRAKLIARDQVGKFYAELQQTRQKSLGLERYIWRTSDDARVREVHAEREGMLCDWEEGPGDASDPGDGEHPGDGINCRCYAEVYLDDLTGDAGSDSDSES